MTEECTCEGEFIWACGPECNCYHHTQQFMSSVAAGDWGKSKAHPGDAVRPSVTSKGTWYGRSTRSPKVVQAGILQVKARVFREVEDELDRATQANGAFNSGHEGWAVIYEELDELWEEVRSKNSGNSPTARREAVQVAAMAIRYIIDVCEPNKPE